MSTVNYILFYKSFYVKEEVKQNFQSQFSENMVYELQELDRLLSAIYSGFFDFVIFAYDEYSEIENEFIQKLLSHKNKLPFVVVANDYKVSHPVLERNLQAKQEVYFLSSKETKDLPGISLRILKENQFYQRKFERKSSQQNLELGFKDSDRLSIQVKNISQGGIQFCSRLSFDKNECPYLFHQTATGSDLNIPIQILWKKKNTDGRWTYGAKYLSQI